MDTSHQNTVYAPLRDPGVQWPRKNPSDKTTVDFSRPLAHITTATAQPRSPPEKELPPEILSQVFCHCQAGESVRLPFRCNSLPWVLGRVCSRWRQVALNEPRLWTNLHVTFPKRGNSSDFAMFTGHVLARSRYASISLAIESADRLQDYLTPLVDSCYSRLGKLSVSFDEHSFPLFIRDPIGSMEFLEAMTIGIIPSKPYGGRNTQLNELRQIVLHDAQRLRKIKIQSSVFAHSAPLDGSVDLWFPWSQLTHIKFVNIGLPYSTVLDILPQCHALTKFQFDMTCNGYMPHLVSPVVVPHLRTMKLSIIGCFNFTHFIDSLILPSLKTLKLSSLHDPGESITSLINRSSCSLEYLMFFMVKEIPHGVVNRIMSSTPLLSSYHMLASPISDATLHAITEGHLLPCLEILHCRITTNSLHNLLNLLEMRWSDKAAGYKGIREARIKWSQYKNRSVADRNHINNLLLKFKAQGRDILVSG